MLRMFNCTGVCFVVALIGCTRSEFDVQKIKEQKVLFSLVFRDPRTSPVDMLFVIDNSGSMSDEQSLIAQKFNDWIQDELLTYQDFRGCVTTTNAFLSAGQGSPLISTVIDPSTTFVPDPAMPGFVPSPQHRFNTIGPNGIRYPDMTIVDHANKALLRGSFDSSNYNTELVLTSMLVGLAHSHSAISYPISGFVNEGVPAPCWRENSIKGVFFATDEVEQSTISGNSNYRFTAAEFKDHLLDGVRSYGNDVIGMFGIYDKTIDQTNGNSRFKNFLDQFPTQTTLQFDIHLDNFDTLFSEIENRLAEVSLPAYYALEFEPDPATLVVKVIHPNGLISIIPIENWWLGGTNNTALYISGLELFPPNSYLEVEYYPLSLSD